jgi:hypothetical protein
MGNNFCISCCYHKYNNISKVNNISKIEKSNVIKNSFNTKKFIKGKKSKNLYKTSPGKPFFILNE